MKIFFSFWLFLVLTSNVNPQTNESSSESEKIINLIGARLNKVFSSFSYPTDVSSFGEENNFDAFLDYFSFGFKISKKTVVICYFFKDYDKSIRGVQIGDNKEALIQKWGNPTVTKKSSSGSPILIWNLNELDAYLIAWLDENSMIKKITVELK